MSRRGSKRKKSRDKLPAPPPTAFDRFNRVWQFDIDPFILGVFRVYIGLYVLSLYLMLAPSWLEYYGPGGISTIPVLEPSQYKLFYSVLQYIGTDLGMWVFYGFCVIAAICLTIGWASRPAVIFLWVSNFSMVYRNPYVVNGEEQVLAVVLLFAVFMPLSASVTLSQLRDRERRQQMLQNDQKYSVWALRPLQIHTMFVYLISVPAKLTSDGSWIDGTVVYYATMAMNYPRWPGLEIFAWGNAFLSRMMTYFTLLVEVVAPVLIWRRRFRVLFVLLCIGLQTGLGLLLSGVVMFNGAMIGALLLFLPSRATRELFRHGWSIEALWGYLWAKEAQLPPAPGVSRTRSGGRRDVAGARIRALAGGLLPR